MRPKMTETKRDAVLALDNYCCQNCGTSGRSDKHGKFGDGLHIHEVVLKSEGGTKTPDNQITLCWKCHPMAHNGRKLADGTWQSGRQFMLEVLDKLKNRVPFRWRAARRHLINSEARTRVSA